MTKVFYIYSFYNNDELDYSWFIGEDFKRYEEQEMECANDIVESGVADNYSDALEKLEGVYKQDDLLEKLTANDYSYKKDLEGIKEQIKTWERLVDQIIKTDKGMSKETALLLEDMSHEMMTINT